MNLTMRIYSIILCSLALWLVGCEKSTTGPTLPDGDIAFDIAAGKDTVQIPLSILKDSTMTLDIRAAMAGNGANGDHWVRFRVEPELLNEYRAEYGEAQLLPTSSYLLYKADARVPAGSTTSEAAVLNVARQTKLLEYTTYVLPIVIESVNGDVDAAGAGDVLYYVFKTGRPAVINKTGWTIHAYSSHLGTFLPTNLLNNTPTNYWASSISEQMPQFVTIDFNRNVTFSGVRYALAHNLDYPSQGGYPTLIQIETSMDGSNWENKGIFEDEVVDKAQMIEIGVTTARYLRFTSLEAVPYSGFYAIFISDISLMP